MRSITIQSIHELLAVSSDPCVSIYLPTIRKAPESSQNPIRLRGLIGRAEKLLLAEGHDEVRVAALLAPLRELASTDALRGVEGAGLALFVADGVFERYDLAAAVDELVIVGHRFHTLPLIRLLRADGAYWALAVSEKHARLLRGNRGGAEEVPVEGMPQGFEAALMIDEHEHGRQFHSRESVRLGKRAGSSFGTQTGEGESHKRKLLEYFRLIDKAIQPVIGESGAPLVVMGVDYYLPIYAEANRYPHLLDQGVSGSPERLDARRIHELAWKVVEPFFLDTARPRALYERLRSQDLARTALDQVLIAAHRGLVEVLFVAADASSPGTFDPDSHRVVTTRRSGQEDLLDLAAGQTLLHGGEVIPVSREKVPDGGLVAAGMRNR